MTNYTTVALLGLAMLASIALTTSQAKEAPAANPQQTSSTSLTSKLLPQTRTRSSRSISDMFEKVKSKIFGAKKQAAASASVASQIQPASSINSAQRQPWADLNALNQQFSPYSSMSGSNYQWPSNGQFMNQAYSPVGNFMGSQSSPSGYSPIGVSQSQSAGSAILSGLDGQSAAAGQTFSTSNSPAANGGILSSASHLIAQYLSPNAGSSVVGSSPSSAQSLAQSSQQPQQQGQLQTNSQAQSLISPQQQQAQYNEFASILDSMVAQTGAGAQRQPNMNQFMSGPQTANQQANSQQGFASQPAASGYQTGQNNMLSSGQMMSDNDMSASSNVQSYVPASPQQASQKSSMVSLAEQLAPGAQFNKLISFPFSLSSNDDPSKDGRFKLHIPFLNQHVKRSDQQQQVAAQRAQQQQQQQYINSYLNQQQMMAQSSQVAPSIVSPQSSGQSQSASPAQSSPVATSGISPSSQSSSLSASLVPSQSISQVSSQSASIPQSSSQVNPSSSSSSIQTNQRPSWSVADLQSSASSSKLIPIQSADSPSVEPVSQS